jgi:hypothetical protein
MAKLADARDLKATFARPSTPRKALKTGAKRIVVGVHSRLKYHPIPAILGRIRALPEMFANGRLTVNWLKGRLAPWVTGE